MQRMRQHMKYRPRVAYAGLGLVHVHVFIKNAPESWLQYPYAIDRAWTVDRPGNRMLYLHCLLPREHLARVPAGSGITTIATSDGWQHLELQAMDRSGRPVERATSTPDVLAAVPPSVISEQPFIVPVACELLQSASMELQWRSIRERLGARVWEYFPRHTRRWPRNGKAYVRQAFTFLNRYGLVLQHTVMYEPLRTHTLELFLIVEGTKTLLDALASVSPSMEFYQGKDQYFVRVAGDIALLKRIISTPGIKQWWFVDHERTKNSPPVRFAYETLFDPRTKQWQVPK
jgi:hypothetical protein